MIPLLIALPVGPMLAWKRGDLPGAMQRLAFAVLAALVAVVAVFAVEHRGPWLAPFGIALGVYVMAATVIEWANRVKLGSAGRDEVARRATNLPRSAYGTLFAHFGIGMLMVGIVATSAYREEHILAMKPGDKVMVDGYQVTFTGVERGRGPNYTEDIADFNVKRDGETVARLQPAKRLYDAPPQPTTESGIHAAWRGDLYVVIGDKQPGGGYAVRAYFNPLVRFIWLGALLMFFGGGISLSDRRLRVGAPARPRAAFAGSGGVSSLRRLMAVAALAVWALVGVAPAALAVQPGEMLADPALEKRARAISAELRCLVCQNQSIDDSDAPLAGDLRRLVRERLKDHDTDQQVLDYIVARYGEFVLLKPRFELSTLLLWLTPVLVLLGGLVLIIRANKPAGPSASEPLTEQEKAKLSEILAAKDQIAGGTRDGPLDYQQLTSLTCCRNPTSATRRIRLAKPAFSWRPWDATSAPLVDDLIFKVSDQVRTRLDHDGGNCCYGIWACITGAPCARGIRRSDNSNPVRPRPAFLCRHRRQGEAGSRFGVRHQRRRRVQARLE